MPVDHHAADILDAVRPLVVVVDPVGCLVDVRGTEGLASEN